MTGRTGGTGEKLFAISPQNTTPLITTAVAYFTYPINRMSGSTVPIQTLVVPAAAAASAAAAAAASCDDDAVALSCCLRVCKHAATRDVLVIPCAKPTCPKGMHLSCFTSKYKYADFPKLVQNVQIVCTKGCYKAVASPKALSWRNDGPVGREEAGCSENILLQWLREEGNYALYRGGPQTKGKTKKKVAAQIARIINEKGVNPPKNAKQVENKIHHIEKQFRTAHDWSNTVTGAGLQENDRGSFDDAIKYRCPQYFFLIDVMIERSSMQPKATNMNLDSSESDDNMGDDDEEDEEGEVAVTATANTAVGPPRRSRHGSDISALGASGRKRRATSVAGSYYEPDLDPDGKYAKLATAKTEYYKNRADKVLDESAVLKLRKGAEAARAEADVAKAKADVAKAAADELAVKRQLFDSCKDFVKTNDGAATKEQILELFPMYADVIDMVLRLQHTSGA
jgi:hypothetical protein